MTVSCPCSTSSNGLQALLEAAADCKRLLIFTGSGLSATSGVYPWEICSAGSCHVSPEWDHIGSALA